MPHTRASLAADLRELGVRRGSVLLVHASLRALGYVCGGPHAVALALRDVLGPDGTLVVPTHTADNSDPAQWRNPPVPEHWWPIIRGESPGFDPAVTPSTFMGALAELVRNLPGARRSDHPHVSFAAVGPEAEGIVAGHALVDMLGEESPLARLYERSADVLLLGVGHDSNTSLHLAEYRRPDPPRERLGAAVLTGAGDRRWVWWTDVVLDSDVFPGIGAELEAAGRVRIGRVGAGPARLMDQRTAVDFAQRWLTAAVRRSG
ncbi:AAC(3) family N-acetyltransferase [Plantactinospora sp. KBS50]|nr:AAC(3) family N-acetyltransferase [Plantactinospora sp. KBS50]